MPGISAKATELLCYLLLHRDRGHTREALAALFWPDAQDYVAKKYLRQAIWRLQSALGSSELLLVEPGWIRVNPKAALWLDVAELEEAQDIYRNIPGRELTDQQVQILEAAAALYRGDLIEAWYQDWCISERDRIQLIYLAMLEQLTLYCEAHQRYTQGIAYGQRILRYDPARECTHRNLMRLYYESDDRTTALRQYERCTLALEKQFSVHPSRETVALYHQVRSDRLEAFAPQATDTARTGSDLLLGLQTGLDHIQASLTALQRQVQQLVPVSQIQEAG